MSQFKDQFYNSVNRSVSQAIQQEKLWQATVDGSYAGFVVLVPKYEDGQIVDFLIDQINDTAATQFNTTVDKVRGKYLNEVFPINKRAGYFQQYRDAYLTGQPFERQFAIPEGIDGHGDWIQMVTPIEGAVVLRNRKVDTSDNLRELEAELMKDRTRMLERVIREAGHDLRTPMSIIKTSLYLAKMADDPDKRVEYQQQARDQVGRLNEILDELIDIAKMKEHGADFRVMDSAEFIQCVYNDFKVLADEAGRTLLVESHKGYSVLISEERMYRAYSNLVRNALAYTDSGDTITLKVDATDSDVHLIVEDTGIGISEENMQKIFDRFYRVDVDRAASEGNQGMGLSIAKEIVDAHGGLIDVKSQCGIGTSFTIILPRISS